MDASGILVGVVVGGLLGFGGTAWQQQLQARTDRRKEERADARTRAARLRAAYERVLEAHTHAVLEARTQSIEERLTAELHTLGQLSAQLALEPDRFDPNSLTELVGNQLAELVAAVQHFYGAANEGTVEARAVARQAHEAGWDKLVEAMNVHLAQLEAEHSDTAEAPSVPWWPFWRR